MVNILARIVFLTCFAILCAGIVYVVWAEMSHPPRATTKLAVYDDVRFEQNGEGRLVGFRWNERQTQPLYIQFNDEPPVPIQSVDQKQLEAWGFRDRYGKRPRRHPPQMTKDNLSRASLENGRVIWLKIYCYGDFKLARSVNGPYVTLPAEREALIGVFGEPTEWRTERELSRENDPWYRTDYKPDSP